jgi:hypothetical protein
MALTSVIKIMMIVVVIVMMMMMIIIIIIIIYFTAERVIGVSTACLVIIGSVT